MRRCPDGIDVNDVTLRLPRGYTIEVVNASSEDGWTLERDE